jgi:hypothetical protein
MNRDSMVLCSRLSPNDCQQRIIQASQDPAKIIGYALSSQIDVIDDGDSFTLRHKLEPAVFRGTVSAVNAGKGAIVAGQIEVPGQRRSRFCTAFVSVVGLAGLASSAWDLAFGTHFLLTRSRMELGPGHWASPEEHWLVFILIPLVAVPIIAVLWPTARGVSKEARQTVSDCLERLFGELSGATSVRHIPDVPDTVP